MNVDCPRVPYDDDNSLHPMRHFAFLYNENAALTIKTLLDHGMSADAAAEMWGHATFDLYNLDCGIRSCNEFWDFECTWVVKMIMLCASYDHILENDIDLQNFIDREHNPYDIHRFRNWNDFLYEFDTSTCRSIPEFYGSTVHIYESDSKKKVWKMRIS